MVWAFPAYLEDSERGREGVGVILEERLRLSLGLSRLRLSLLGPRGTHPPHVGPRTRTARERARDGTCTHRGDVATGS